MSRENVFRPVDKDKREIRLIHLQSILAAETGGALNRIEACFSYTSLSSENYTKYRALSYVWGNNTFASSVVLDDGSYIPITQSLLVALEHIFANGYAPDDLPIWIDGLCINQADDVEKSWQVQQMRDVYASAEETLIFLGPRSELSDAAIDMFHSTGQTAQRYGCIGKGRDHYKIAKKFVDDFFDGPEHSMNSDSPPAEQFLQDVLKDGFTHGYMPLGLVSEIMDRPWWSRMWVLQELLASQCPTFICGLKKISADVLVASMGSYTLLRLVWLCISALRSPSLEQRAKVSARYLAEIPADYHDCPIIVMYTDRLLGRRPPTDYTSVMLLTQTCPTWWHDVPSLQVRGRQRMQASDPRDYVFPFVTLTSSVRPESLDFSINYACSVVDLYVRTTLDFIKARTSGLLVSASGQPADSRIKGLPSWVPDWSAKGHLKGSLLRKYAPSVQPVGYSHLAQSGHELSVHGRRYGDIKTIWNDKLQNFSLIETGATARSLEYLYILGQLLARHSGGSHQTITYHHAMARSLNVVISGHHLRSDGTFRVSDSEEESIRATETHDVQRYVIGLGGEFEDNRADLSFAMVKDVNDELKVKQNDEPRKDVISERAASLQRWQGSRQWAIDQVSSIMPFYNPFICNEYAGFASMNTEDGDVLAEIDCDPQGLFILRDAGEGRYTIVGYAIVGQLWDLKALGENRGTRTTFHIL